MSAQTEKWVGKKLSDGRYEVLRFIGEGGMAVVYLVYDNKMGAESVIKVPRYFEFGDIDLSERFAREVRSLITLQHPHVVRVTDLGDHESMPFAVMQYLSGGSLQDKFDGKADSIPRLSLWLPQIASALDYLHSQGVIHRDIKPANILFDQQPTPNAYLGDFGIVKSIADEEKLTRTGAIIGTPAYMPLEALMGAELGPPSDVFSLAVIVYERLCGQRPFQGNTAAEYAFAQNSGPKPIEEINPNIGRPIIDVLNAALSKDAADRPQSCTEFVTKLFAARDASKESRPAPPPVATRPAEPTQDTTPVNEAETKVEPSTPEPVAPTAPQPNTPVALSTDTNHGVGLVHKKSKLGWFAATAGMILAAGGISYFNDDSAETVSPPPVVETTGMGTDTEDPVHTTQRASSLAIMPISAIEVKKGNLVEIIPKLESSEAHSNLIEFDVSPLPEGAKFDAKTGKLSWMPIEAGVFDVSLSVKAIGGNVSDIEDVKIVVSNPPQFGLNDLSEIETKPGKKVQIKLQLENSDYWSGRVEFGANGLPAKSAFDVETGVFSWTPRAMGTTTIEFTAESGCELYRESKSAQIVVSQITRSELAALIDDMDYWCPNAQDLEQVSSQVAANLKQDPRDTLSLVVRAAVMIKEAASQTDDEERMSISRAVNDCKTAITIDPDMAIAFYMRGYARNAIRQGKIGIADLETAIRLDPDYASAHLECGCACYQTDQYEKALEHFSAAIDCDPSKAHAYHWRGFVKKELNRPFSNDFDQAIKLFTEMIDRDENKTCAYLLRSNTWREYGDEARALDDLKAAFKSDPLNETFRGALVFGYAKYADSLRFDRQYDRALSAIDDGVREFGELPAFSQARAAVYQSHGNEYQLNDNYPKAIEQLKLAVKYAPRDVFIHHHLATLWMIQGDNEKAIELLEGIKREMATFKYSDQRAENESLLVLTTLGDAKRNSQKHREALKNYNEALPFCDKVLARKRLTADELRTAKSQKVNVLFGRGCSWHELKEYKKAISDFEDAIKILPSKALYEMLGHAYEQNGDDDKAKQAKQRAKTM